MTFFTTLTLCLCLLLITIFIKAIRHSGEYNPLIHMEYMVTLVTVLILTLIVALWR